MRTTTYRLEIEREGGNGWRTVTLRQPNPTSDELQAYGERSGRRWRLIEIEISEQVLREGESSGYGGNSR